jgi:guanylate kinase
MTMENQVRAMAHATQDLDRRLDGRHRDKLKVIQELLEEIGDDLDESK